MDQQTGPHSMGDRKGQALVITAAGLITVLGLAALAVDVGMLYTAHGEAQRSADAIALAGASAFIGNAPQDFLPDAKERSREYAAVNFVRNQALDTTIIDESADSWRSAEVTVDIILDSMKVRARVQRDGVGLWFARVLGADFATVRADAAAVAAEAGASSCMVPFAIPIDPSTTMTLGQLMVLKTADSSTVAGVDPFFAPFAMEPDPNVPNYCPRARGDDADQAWGGSNVCSTCAPSTGRFPGEAQGGWHQATPVDEWLAGEQSPGGSYYPGDGYAENICGNNCSQINAGEQRTIVTGDMDGPTSWGVNARLALDPDVTWNENDNQVYRGNTPLDDYGSTPRVVKVPTFDRNELTHSSDRTFTINGFSYFFLERGPDAGFYNPTDQLEIIGRFLYHAPGDAGGGSIYSRVLRLVE